MIGLLTTHRRYGGTRQLRDSGRRLTAGDESGGFGSRQQFGEHRPQMPIFGRKTVEPRGARVCVQLEAAFEQVIEAVPVRDRQ